MKEIKKLIGKLENQKENLNGLYYSYLEEEDGLYYSYLEDNIEEAKVCEGKIEMLEEVLLDLNEILKKK